MMDVGGGGGGVDDIRSIKVYQGEIRWVCSLKKKKKDFEKIFSK